MNTTPTGESIQNLLRVNKGVVIATFDLITSSGIRIPDFTLINGKKGWFVSPPQRKDSKGWKPLLKLPGYVKKELTSLAIQELKNLSSRGKKEKEPPWKPPKLSPAAQKEADYIEWKKNNH